LDVRSPAKELPSFAFSHAAPDSPLDPVVERLSEALDPDRAAGAEDAGSPLVCALGKQSVSGSPALGGLGPRLVFHCNHELPTFDFPSSTSQRLPDPPSGWVCVSIGDAQETIKVWRLALEAATPVRNDPDVNGSRRREMIMG
jgi:hypothetical protein